MELVTWRMRTPQEAHLFNPAFCGALTFEFVKEFQRAKSQSVPYALPFCALPVSLHPKTRQSLPKTTLTSLYSWIEEHEPALVGLGERTRNLSPLVKEGLRFAMDRDVIELNSNGDLVIGSKRASFTSSIMTALTPDAKECVRATQMLGRWFAKAGSPSTILSAWGFRP